MAIMKSEEQLSVRPVLIFIELYDEPFLRKAKGNLSHMFLETFLTKHPFVHGYPRLIDIHLALLKKKKCNLQESSFKKKHFRIF